MPDSNSTLIIRPCIKCGHSSRDKSNNCKNCASIRSKKWFIENRVRSMVTKNAWKLANIDSVKASAVVLRQKNKEANRIKDAAKYIKNKEVIKARSKAWLENNHGKRLVQQKIYREKHPEKIKEWSAAWSASNPEALRVQKQNRRAKEKGAGRISKTIVEKLFKLQKGVCPCCRQPLGKDYHLDHKMPLALGGPNTDDNMQLLRQRCNQQKGAKHPVDFMQSRGFLL